MKKIYPVLLAGGSGTRLWPLSRTSYPKQFSKFIGEMTLFQQSASRLSSTKELDFHHPIAVTNEKFRFIVNDQLNELNRKANSILIEPCAKNTAPAILAASIYAKTQDDDAILLVSPTDHLITDTIEFHNVVNAGLRYIDQGNIVTFGIVPTRPDTGYGYLELDNQLSEVDRACKVKKFIEKPEETFAEKFFSSGNHLWNAGIFLFKASDIISAFDLHMPDISKFVKEALFNAKKDNEFLCLDNECWNSIEEISIDYAIMEKLNNLVAIPFNSKWTDLGGWDAIWLESEKDENQNAVSDGAHAISCKGSILRSESREQELVGLGLDNIIAIAMPDAVLVADKKQAQNIKTVVSHLKHKGVKQAESFQKDHRPWGWFETIALAERFQVKRIYVKPGAALSLQSHHHRSEHWVVVQGTANVTIDETVRLVTEGESVFIPLGAVHRLENPGKVPMMLIEVQTGTYLGEDDIIRYEDMYSRT